MTTNPKAPTTPKGSIIPNNPLVSIIVPVYNTEKYLSKCLDSITNQSYQNLEIICINDGSTDSSLEVLKAYASKDHRIKIISQKNQGLSAARNNGIKKSSGKFITFVDSDDYIEPKMVEHLITALQSTNTDLSICSFKETYPGGKITHFNQNYRQATFTTEFTLKAMLLEQGFMVSATMKLFPANYFKNIKFPVGKLHEDVGTTYKLIMKAQKIVFVPNEDYVYVHHNDSIINQSFDNRRFDLIELTDQMCDDIEAEFPNLKNTTNERRMRARFSILRQISLHHPRTKTILNYLKTHRSYIFNNPEATKTDRIAMRLALISPKLFQLTYKLFK